MNVGSAARRVNHCNNTIKLGAPVSRRAPKSRILSTLLTIYRKRLETLFGLSVSVRDGDGHVHPVDGHCSSGLDAWDVGVCRTPEASRGSRDAVGDAARASRACVGRPDSRPGSDCRAGYSAGQASARRPGDDLPLRRPASFFRRAITASLKLNASLLRDDLLRADHGHFAISNGGERRPVERM
jgi:hypothetical protein